jgi:hypothetical protein
VSAVKEKLTYANVMATLALFIALGAGAYAAGLPKNSVKAKQIKAGAVRTAELAGGAVTSPKVANASLLGEDFAPGQLPAGPTGPQGAQGDQGPPGPTFGSVTGPNPEATAEFLVLQRDFTLPAAGKVLALYTSQGVTLNCSAGNGSVGLYVDAVAVPGTRRDLTSGVPTPVTMFGISAPLAAGAHRLEYGADCPAGNVTSQSFPNNHSMGVVLLGG